MHINDWVNSATNKLRAPNMLPILNHSPQSMKPATEVVNSPQVYIKCMFCLLVIGEVEVDGVVHGVCERDVVHRPHVVPSPAVCRLPPPEAAHRVAHGRGQVERHNSANEGGNNGTL